MIRHINRHYYLDTDRRLLFRTEIDPKKHLLWSAGGVPTINARVADSLKGQYDTIGFKYTDGRKFTVNAELFHEHKQTVMHREPQYFINKFFIIDL